MATQTPEPQRCPAAHWVVVEHVHTPSVHSPLAPHCAFVAQVPQVPCTQACPPPHWLLGRARGARAVDAREPGEFGHPDIARRRAIRERPAGRADAAKAGLHAATLLRRRAGDASALRVAPLTWLAVGCGRAGAKPHLARRARAGTALGVRRALAADAGDAHFARLAWRGVQAIVVGLASGSAQTGETDVARRAIAVRVQVQRRVVCEHRAPFEIDAVQRAQHGLRLLPSNDELLCIRLRCNRLSLDEHLDTMSRQSAPVGCAAHREGKEPGTDRARRVVALEAPVHLNEDVLGDVLEVALVHPEPPERGPHVIELLIEERPKPCPRGGGLRRRVNLGRCASHRKSSRDQPVTSEPAKDLLLSADARFSPGSRLERRHACTRTASQLRALRPRPSARLVRREDLRERVHVVQRMRGRDAGERVSELRRRARSTAHPTPRGPSTRSGPAAQSRDHGAATREVLHGEASRP